MYILVFVVVIGVIIVFSVIGVYNINGLFVRVKSLFIKYTKIGNLFVDSVVEY